METKHLTVESLSNESSFNKMKKEWKNLFESKSIGKFRKYNKILLINPPVTLYKHDLPRCTYPLGIGYIASVLEQNEYIVKIQDVFAEGYYTETINKDQPDYIHYGQTDMEVSKFISDFDPDFVGVSSIFSNQSDNVHRMLKIAKEVNPEIITGIGGAHARYFPESCLEDTNLDVVFLGESELIFLEYIESINGYYPFDDVVGIAYKKEEKINIKEGNSLIRSEIKKNDGELAELDQIPFPAWHLYNMERYFEIKAYQSPYTIGDRVGQIYTSRGCSAKCTFCTTTNFWGNALRRRSSKNVVDELTILKEKYRINEFHIQDDNITNDMKHAKNIFKGFRTLNLPWATPQGTALWRMDEELLDLMAESGLYQITFAIESGVQRVLKDLIQKPLNLKKTKHLISYARKLGINVHGFFIIGMPPMFGNPGETIEEMYQTYNFANDCEFNSASFFTAVPIIGSELLRESLRQGFLDKSIPLYQMTYKQGLLNVPGLWSSDQISELAAKFNSEFNTNDQRAGTIRNWDSNKY